MSGPPWGGAGGYSCFAMTPKPTPVSYPTNYWGVLRYGPTVRPFAATLIARLPIAMAPLGIILLVQQVRGSYGIAGIITGAFAVGTAVGAPIWGRLMDRFGQARVILPIVLISASFLAAVALTTVAGAGNTVLLSLAFSAGATFPPFSAAMRSTWRMVLPEGPGRRAGYALDAVAVETLFVGGPLLLSLLLIFTPPVAPLLITAGLMAAGGIAYCLTEPARRRALPSGMSSGVSSASASVSTSTSEDGSSQHQPRRQGLLSVMAPGLPVVFFIMAAMSIGFGVIDTSLAAVAREILGNQNLLGVLFAAIAGASAIGGLLYGGKASHEHDDRRLAIFLGVFTLGLIPLPFLLASGAPPLWAVLPLLSLAGLSIAPSLIILQNLVDRLSPVGRNFEAQAWLSTSSTTGGAAGAAIAGLLIDTFGVPWSFVGAAAAVLLSCLLAAQRLR